MTNRSEGPPASSLAALIRHTDGLGQVPLRAQLKSTSAPKAYTSPRSVARFFPNSDARAGSRSRAARATVKLSKSLPDGEKIAAYESSRNDYCHSLRRLTPEFPCRYEISGGFFIKFESSND